ncbi:MAG: PKD domain-containing protein [Candidatus Zambryskibacteria bacterium]|nr:PKD domain-containing protein [Candidatus Zambryskibacteria bacterium]
MTKKYISIFLLTGVLAVFPSDTSAVTSVPLANTPQSIILDKHFAEWGSDFGFNAPWKIEQPWGLVKKRKLQGEVAFSLPNRDFYFPVKVWFDYDPLQIYPGNTTKIKIHILPFEDKNKTEFKDFFGLKAYIGYYEKTARPCWPQIRCWGPWVGVEKDYDLEVDASANGVPPMMSDDTNIEMKDDQNSTFGVDFFSINAISLGIQTRTVETFKSGYFDGDIFYMRAGQGFGSASEPGTINTKNMSFDSNSNSYVQTYDLNIPKDASVGEMMQLAIPALKYHCKYNFKIGLVPQISLWKPDEEAIIYNKTVNLESNPGQLVFYTQVISHNEKPVASAGLDITAVQGDRIQLDGSKSKDPDGYIEKYRWYIPGNFDKYSQITSVDTTKFLAGEYDVKLTVTDDNGATGEDTLKLLVKEPARYPDIVVDDNYLKFPREVLVGKAFNVTARICNEGDGVSPGFMSKLQWQKANGSWNQGQNTWTASLVVGNCQEKTWPVTVTEAAHYNFKLTVDSENHARDESNETNNIITKNSVEIETIPNQAPVANLKIDISNQSRLTNGTKYWPFGTLISLDSSGSKDENNKIVRYIWDYNDGEIITKDRSSVMTHTYGGSGKYNVKLYVEDDTGLSNQTSSDVLVLPQTVKISTPADADITYNSVLLKWELPTQDKNLAYFKVRYDPDPGAPVEYLISKDVKQFVVPNLNDSKTYNFEFYTVSELNGNQYTSLPAKISVKTKPAVKNLTVRKDVESEMSDIRSQMTAPPSGGNTVTGGQSQVGLSGGSSGGSAGGTVDSATNTSEYAPRKIYFQVANIGTASVNTPNQIYFTATYVSLDDSANQGNLVSGTYPHGYVTLSSTANGHLNP